MQDARKPGSQDGAPDPDVRLTTRITPAVDRRLRMLALVKGQSLANVVTGLLEQALPPAEELASALSGPLAQADAETAA